MTDALPRRLGLAAAIGTVVGSIIGSGIFRVPGLVAGHVDSTRDVMVVWVVGGVISLCGALSLAELATLFPRSGGIFVYLREVYGDLVAFLFGWTMLFIGPAGIAPIALVFAEYLAVVVPGAEHWTRAIAAVLIALTTAFTYRSVTGVGGLLTASSAAKVVAIVALVVAVFAAGDAAAGAFNGQLQAPVPVAWSGFGLALVAALWAYNGFQDMICVAGEVRDPGRVLPRALFAGVIVVVLVYLAANAAYLYALPLPALRDSQTVASDAMVRTVGEWGTRAVAVMVLISTFGATVAVTLSTPRIYYAMAAAGLLFRPLARVHSRFATPHVAVAAQGVAAVACVYLQTFEQLTSAFVLGMWPFVALATAGVIVLRRRHPELPRPYRTPGYPWVPLVFIGGTLWVVGTALVAQPATTLTGIGLTLLGVPVYLIRRRQRRAEPVFT